MEFTRIGKTSHVFNDESTSRAISILNLLHYTCKKKGVCYTIQGDKIKNNMYLHHLCFFNNELFGKLAGTTYRIQIKC